MLPDFRDKLCRAHTSHIKHLAVRALSNISACVKSRCNFTEKCLEMPNVIYTQTLAKIEISKMPKNKSNIFMVIPFQSSFIKGDIDILSGKYSIILNTYNWRNKYLTALFMILQFLSLLKNIWVVKVIVIEFGGYWALIPSIFGKLFNIPVVIILHGTDCASMPQIAYGSLRKKLLKLSCKISYHLASALVPVSDSLIFIKNEYNDKHLCQGLKYHFPELETPLTVVHNGLDTTFWTPSESTPRESNRFIAVFSQTQFILKGGDLILSLAELNPNYNFYIAGTEKPQHLDKELSNIHFLGKISKEELREEYRKSTFHLQLSMFEGFGLALCEAMLCGCIPIGSSVNIIPEIIGDTGFVLEKRNVNRLIYLVKKASLVKNKNILGAKARERIESKFPMSGRKKLLIKIIANQIEK